MTAPGSLFEIVTAGLVGTDQPRFWVASPDEAQALIRGAGMVFTVGDLHTHPAEHGEGWAIVRAPSAPTLAVDLDSLRMAYAVGWTDSMHAAPGSDASVHEPAAWVAVLRYLAEHHGDTRCRDLVR